MPSNQIIRDYLKRRDVHGKLSCVHLSKSNSENFFAVNVCFKRFHIYPDVMMGLNWKHELCRRFLTYMKPVDLSITKPNTRFFIRRSPPWITQSRLAFSVDLLRSNFMSKSSRNHHQALTSWTFWSLPNDGSWREETGGDSSDTKSVLPSYNFPKFFCRQRKALL